MRNQLQAKGAEPRSVAGPDEPSPCNAAALHAVDPMEGSREVERVVGERLNTRLECARESASLPERSVIELFCRVDARRADSSPYVLQFVAATPGAGTSTVAAAFASVAAVLMHRPVLLVGLVASELGAPSVLATLAAGRDLNEAVKAVPAAPGLCRASLVDRPMLLTRMAGELEAVLTIIRERFSVVVVDGPAMQDSEASLILSRYCDATVLVVAAEHSHKAAVRSAVSEIGRHGGEVLGTVLNRQKRYLPAWAERLLA
jgi:Mrp family chromosome partitioning ATPase